MGISIKQEENRKNGLGFVFLSRNKIGSMQKSSSRNNHEKVQYIYICVYQTTSIYSGIRVSNFVMFRSEGTIFKNNTPSSFTYQDDSVRRDWKILKR